jgi:hypothetical protein
MSRNKKLIRNLVLIVLLIILYMNRTGLYFSPITAHERSERDLHYGPSEIIHVEDFDGDRYLLCQYDKWISCNVVKRRFFVFWSHGMNPVGFENDTYQKIDYSWRGWEDYSIFWGSINDKDITKIELDLRDGSTMTETEFYDGLFVFSWKPEKLQIPAFTEVRGYNTEGELVFEDIY